MKTTTMTWRKYRSAVEETHQCSGILYYQFMFVPIRLRLFNVHTYDNISSTPWATDPFRIHGQIPIASRIVRKNTI